MDYEEFSRLLQAYMFGKVSPAERQRLAESALESSERAREFSQAEEIRERLADPQFRRELIGMLPAVPPPHRESWWSALWRPRFVMTLAGSAALAAGILLIRDFRSRSSEQQIAQVPTNPGLTKGPAGDLRPPPEKDEALNAVGDPSAAQMADLFALPASQASDFGLHLPGGNRYRASDTVVAAMTLHGGGRVYAIVRGPAGAMREVYPATPREDRALVPGAHSFSFIAAGRMDPESGGRSTLRIFVTQGDAAPSSGRDRWIWLKVNSRFQEAEYEVYVL